MATQTYFYQGEYARSLLAEGEARGEARGEAKAVIRLLDFRDVALTEQDRERIMATTDMEVLCKWIERASYVTSMEELLA
ncbi:MULTISPECIES: hypothetical protein [unclassified Nonomuraea]|uniref:hypothetical protein n=1 Tax=unclassified Nonomuraea TaxID=2593643 RepID=UPI0033F80BB7